MSSAFAEEKKEDDVPMKLTNAAPVSAGKSASKSKSKPAAGKASADAPPTVSPTIVSSASSSVSSSKKIVPQDADNDNDNDDDDDDDDDDDYDDEVEIIENYEPRRGGRKRTSTTMIIDGHTVLTSNNYVLKGDTYVFGAFESDAPKVKKRKPKKPAQKKKEMPAYHHERMAHNLLVKNRMLIDAGKRRRYLTDHFNTLEAFLDEKVTRQLSVPPPASNTIPTYEDKLLAAQPDCVKTTLRDYQLIGLEWMVNMHHQGLPMILGDEMGLGKTLQTISLISHIKETCGYNGPSLVICPLSVLYSWCQEIEKHAPSLTYFRLHSSTSTQREIQKKTMSMESLKYDIIVTTYEMAKSQEIQNLISRLYFNYVVLDEGHVIKCTETQIAHAVRKIHSQNKLILTGTPLQNNLVELYGILNYMYPATFTSSEPFANCFDIGKNRVDADMLLKANKLLKMFMLRRLKVEVEKLMPKKIETKILCPLSSTQVFWYKGFLMDKIETLITASDAENGGETSVAGRQTMLRNLCMQLRKCCLHPYLFAFAEAKKQEGTSIEELIATSGKLAVLDKVLSSMYKNGNRTCIFSQFTSMLNILEDYCVLRGWKYCRFDGSTPRAQRNHLINQFNAPGSDDFIFLMSTRSGGLGINLQTADTCILYDSDWNPQPDLQAMARVHRIGQKKTVHVYRLVSSGTIEERMIERAEKKLYLDQMVNKGVSSQQMDDAGGGLTAAELLETLKFGSNAVFSSSNEMPTENDIDKLTDRERSEETSQGMLKGGVAKTAKDFESEKVMLDTMTLEGVDFRALRDKEREKSKKKTKVSISRLKQVWKGYNEDDIENMGKGKRVKKSRIVNFDGIGSGYGAKHVPVLAMNNYDLLTGEGSVWEKEAKRNKQVCVPVEKKPRITFFSKTQNHDNQDFCQACGDGGMLILCPRCPIAIHERCCGITADQFMSCSHHRCTGCGKNQNEAGGLLYPCQSCIQAFCEDCVPKTGVRYLGSDIPRFEALGHEGVSRVHYIHCSEQCENVAKIEFGFKVSEAGEKEPSPPTIDVSYAFGKSALSAEDVVKKFAGKYVPLPEKMEVIVPHKSSVESPAAKQSNQTSTRRSPRRSPITID